MMRERKTVDLETVIVRNEELLTSDLDGETIMLSVESGNYYGLDQVGSRLWALIEQPRSVSDLCDMLVAEFDVERDQCEKDILAFLHELVDEKIVKVADASDR
jgi:hypothetical protein